MYINGLELSSQLVEYSSPWRPTSPAVQWPGRPSLNCPLSLSKSLSSCVVHFGVGTRDHVNVTTTLSSTIRELSGCRKPQMSGSRIAGRNCATSPSRCPRPLMCPWVSHARSLGSGVVPNSVIALDLFLRQKIIL